MVRSFRKYHRTLAVIMTLPLTVTILTGLGYTILGDWLGMQQVSNVLLGLHNGELFGLGEIYPVLNGLGAIALLITGVTMTRVGRRSPRSSSD